MTGGIKNDASLRGKVRAVAKECGLRSQEVLNMYLFEHLLLRLSQSGYADKFILKGGLLMAAITGMARRTTMDMGKEARSASAALAPMLPFRCIYMRKSENFNFCLQRSGIFVRVPFIALLQ